MKKQELILKNGEKIELYNNLFRVKTNKKIYSFNILNNIKELEIFFNTCKALKTDELDIIIQKSKYKLFFNLNGSLIVECYYSTI